MSDLYTPLKGISLKELHKKPIMLDANILMVGIEDRAKDPNCSFENMKNLYIIPLFACFSLNYSYLFYISAERRTV